MVVTKITAARANQIQAVVDNLPSAFPKLGAVCKVEFMSLSLPAGNCWLAYDLNNKLAIIVGQCELLIEHVQAEEHLGRLQAIHTAAQLMAESLKRHQCELANLLREQPVGTPNAANRCRPFTLAGARRIATCRMACSGSYLQRSQEL